LSAKNTNEKRNFQRAGPYNGFHSHSWREVNDLLEFLKVISPSSSKGWTQKYWK